MTKYDKLREEFTTFDDAERRFVEENESLALQIVDGFREYLEAPSTFEVKTAKGIKIETYTSFHPYSEPNDLAEDTSENDSDSEFFTHALTHKFDGTFKFGFGIVLEREAGNFPKRKLKMNVVCVRRGEKVQIDVSGKSIEVTFDGSTCPEIAAVHSLIFDMVIDWLRRRPGDGKGTAKFGFAMH